MYVELHKEVVDEVVMKEPLFGSMLNMKGPTFIPWPISFKDLLLSIFDAK